MMDTGTTRTAAQILVDALKIHGVDTAFCVPGESYLAVLDALYDARGAIRLIVARQDGGAAYMAEAWAKVTGRPGICFVTRGPGATNASIGVHTAQQDSTPMILFIGQVPGEFADRESFQEVDYRQMFGPMSKWVAQIERADRMHEYVSRAFHLAMSGRPGPVVLALPEDMLTQTASVSDASPYQVVQASPSAADLEKLRRVYQGELLINSGMPQIAAALKGVKLDGSAWRAWREQARADYLEWTKPAANPGRVQLADIVAWLREHLPEDAIIANGAGNFAGWISRFYRYPGLRTQVAPSNGSMGYGVPAGVAAKVAHPERVVVSINGDGDFLMNGQELATAVQYALPVIFVVV